MLHSEYVCGRWYVDTRRSPFDKDRQKTWTMDSWRLLKLWSCCSPCVILVWSFLRSSFSVCYDYVECYYFHGSTVVSMYLVLCTVISVLLFSVRHSSSCLSTESPFVTRHLLFSSCCGLFMYGCCQVRSSFGVCYSPVAVCLGNR